MKDIENQELQNDRKELKEGLQFVTLALVLTTGLGLWQGFVKLEDVLYPCLAIAAPIFYFSVFGGYLLERLLAKI